MVDDDEEADQAVPGAPAKRCRLAGPSECLCCGLCSGEWDPGAPDLSQKELDELSVEARTLALSGRMRYFTGTFLVWGLDLRWRLGSPRWEPALLCPEVALWRPLDPCGSFVRHVCLVHEE